MSIATRKSLEDGRAGALRLEYANRFAGLADYRDRVWKVLCDDYFARHIPAESTVLDLGAGWGEFTRNCVAKVKYAMDLNPETESRVRGHALFLQQDCSKEWPLADAALDVVFTSNFLEHLPDKPHVEATLRHAHRCLRPGGSLICLGPNLRYVPGAYWDFWDHHVPLTDASLAEILQLTGFVVRHRIGRFLPYTMSSGGTPPILFVRAYLRLPIAWRIFGKQFLVCAEKPA